MLVKRALGVALILLTAGQLVSGGKHPDCEDTEIGQNTKEGCGWKYYPATRDRDFNLHPKGTCVACYNNACFNPRSESCKQDCFKYWQLCINYTAPVTTITPNADLKLDVKVKPSEPSDGTQANVATAAAHFAGLIAAVLMAFVVIAVAVVYYVKRRNQTVTNGPFRQVVNEDKGEFLP